MIAVLVVALALALWLILRPPRGVSRRVRMAFRGSYLHGPSEPGHGGGGGGGLNRRRSSFRGRGGARRGKDRAVPLTVVVQQLAALLKGGRTLSRLWDELWVVYAGSGAAVGTPCLLYTSPSPRDLSTSRMPSSA